MDRNALEAYIAGNYPADAEHLWAKYPGYAVFRHGGSQKWFALVMDVPRENLGLTGPGTLDVVDLKCDPILMGSLLQTPGFFPAYHMSKASWITVALDGSVPADTIRMLLDMSYRLSAPKAKKHRPKPEA